MSLTLNEKSIVRLLILRNPDSDYMVKLGQSDEFARSEIAIHKERMIEFLSRRVEALSDNIAKINADLALLNKGV